MSKLKNMSRKKVEHSPVTIHDGVEYWKATIDIIAPRKVIEDNLVSFEMHWGHSMDTVYKKEEYLLSDSTKEQ